MEYFDFRPGLRVSRLGVGCEQLGGADWGECDPSAAAAAVVAACERGVTLFDTANVYGLGQSETRLATALGARRHDAFIVTKGGFRWEAHEHGQRAKTTLDLSRANLRASIEASLRRMQLDTIPLYLLHWPARGMDCAEAVGTLAAARDEGLIRYLGVSNFSVDQLREACRTATIDAVEFSYSLIDADKAELFNFCRERDIRTFGYGALGQGLLTGKYSASTRFPTSDRRHRLAQFASENFVRHAAVVERLVALGRELGRPPSQVAVRWCLDAAPLDAAVVGVKRPAQLEDLTAVAGWRLDGEQMEFLQHGATITE